MKERWKEDEEQKKKTCKSMLQFNSKVIEISIHLSCILFDYIATVIGYKFSILLHLYMYTYTNIYTLVYIMKK